MHLISEIDSPTLGAKPSRAPLFPPSPPPREIVADGLRLAVALLQQVIDFNALTFLDPAGFSSPPNFCVAIQNCRGTTARLGVRSRPDCGPAGPLHGLHLELLSRYQHADACRRGDRRCRSRGIRRPLPAPSMTVITPISGVAPIFAKRAQSDSCCPSDGMHGDRETHVQC
jgi:hypothetical protein